MGSERQDVTDSTIAAIAEAPTVVLGIQIVADGTIGYAAIQNHVPVIRAIAFTNNGDTPLLGLDVLISCSPAFAVGAKLHFERLAPGETRKISPIDLQPDHGYLSHLDELERATVTAKAISSDGTPLADVRITTSKFRL